MTTLLNNKHAVIYGAGGGIGAGVAQTFAREGATVHLAGRTEASLERVASKIAQDGGTATVTVLDALDERAIEAHLDGLERVDVSFNLISRSDVQGRPLLEMSLADFVAPVDSGLRTQFLTATAAARQMATAGSGVILMLTSGSSVATHQGMGGTGPADAAIETLMRYLAAEVGSKGIRVCGIWTAGVPETFALEGDTNVARKSSGMTAEMIEQFIGPRTMLGHAPRLQQVADAAAFLASDHAGGMTGTIANVSCGLVIDR
jgi:NAD(P)-dependent dehydrogenase (short-subunit alcohol dehydrogenase family)